MNESWIDFQESWWGTGGGRGRGRRQKEWRVLSSRRALAALIALSCLISLNVTFVRRPVSAKLVIETFNERPVVERSINSVIGQAVRSRSWTAIDRGSDHVDRHPGRGGRHSLHPLQDPQCQQRTLQAVCLLQGPQLSGVHHENGTSAARAVSFYFASRSWMDASDFSHGSFA